MTAGLSASPLEFPKEFAQVLPHAQVVKGPEELTIGPGAGQTADDPVLLELATTQLRAWLQTYPEIDAVYLSMPEFPDSVAAIGITIGHLAGEAPPSLMGLNVVTNIVWIAPLLYFSYSLRQARGLRN